MEKVHGPPQVEQVSFNGEVLDLLLTCFLTAIVHANEQQHLLATTVTYCFFTGLLKTLDQWITNWVWLRFKLVNPPKPKPQPLKLKKKVLEHRVCGYFVVSPCSSLASR